MIFQLTEGEKNVFQLSEHHSSVLQLVVEFQTLNKVLK